MSEIPTTREDLIEVYAAIRACRAAQQYAIGRERMKLSAQYKDLIADREILLERLRAEEGGDSMTSLGVYGGVE